MFQSYRAALAAVVAGRPVFALMALTQSSGRYDAIVRLSDGGGGAFSAGSSVFTPPVGRLIPTPDRLALCVVDRRSRLTDPGVKYFEPGDALALLTHSGHPDFVQALEVALGGDAFIRLAGLMRFADSQDICHDPIAPRAVIWNGSRLEVVADGLQGAYEFVGEYTWEAVGEGYRIQGSMTFLPGPSFSQHVA